MFGLSKRQINWLIIIVSLFTGSLWVWLDGRSKGDNSAYMVVVYSFAILVAYSTFLFLSNRGKNRDALESLHKQAAILEVMEAGEFEEDDYVFSTRKGEVVIARVNETLVNHHHHHQFRRGRCRDMYHAFVRGGGG